MMKKLLIIALAMALLLVCGAAPAEEQSEGGKKFESNWAKAGGLVEILYEEEGYRVSVDLFNQSENTGTLWEYACFYNEEKDVLESFSSLKACYTVDPQTLDRTFGENEYEGIDDEDAMSVFSLTADGALCWKDGHENLGQDLEFTDIGRFDGVWRNEEEEIYAEIWWRGLYDEETYYYDVFISRGGTEQYANISMEGLYSAESGLLEASGTATVMVRNAAGSYDETADDEIFEAFFRNLGDGKLLWETDNGIELEYDIMGPES